METTTLYNEIESLIDNSQYNEAVKLLQDTFNLEFKVDFLENGFHFLGDKETRDIYSITLKRGQRKYTFKFGASLNDSGFYYMQGRKKTDIDRKFLDPKYNVKVEIKRKDWSFNRQTDTIHKPTAPSLYSVLACLTKYEVGSFENFCDEFGYDSDSITAKKTYKAVAKEYDKMCGLFNNEDLELLQLIN